MPGRLLIVNADDYALTEGICRAVLRGHRDGIVTSTSVMANGPAFDCTKWLQDAPELGVGVHLALVSDDPPVLSAREIPSLVNKRGALAESWTRLVPRLATGRVDADDVERELDAQIAAVADVVGRERLTHLDSHQHLHLWPSIAKVVVRLAQRWDVAGVRVTRSFSAKPVGLGLNALARRLQRRCRAAGVGTTEAFAGFDEGGSLKRNALIEAIERLAATGATTAELATHPGEVADTELGPHHWPYHRADELAGVLAPEVRACIERSGFTLGTYGSLLAHQ